MYYKEETLFEQYPLELTDTYKGRGAVFAMTDIVFSKVIRVRE